jgi:hypothetical protein
MQKTLLERHIDFLENLDISPIGLQVEALVNSRELNSADRRAIEKALAWRSKKYAYGPLRGSDRSPGDPGFAREVEICKKLEKLGVLLKEPEREVWYLNPEHFSNVTREEIYLWKCADFED